MLSRISDIVAWVTTYFPQIRKAVAAGVTAGSAFYTAAQLSGGTVDGKEWLALIGVAVGAALVGWAVPNAEKPPVG